MYSSISLLLPAHTRNEYYTRIVLTCGIGVVERTGRRLIEQWRKQVNTTADTFDYERVKSI